ncbi:Polyketide cyclase / dehydrase and lipid transport [Amycolatopsis xylanica]|uniref:Polyketide cyclase / dehydrase and lipid transport n=1 Tax=Amycolatopsis xylanica TaxID=589385 RepID=A0A1H2VR55_9PSEU|nr:SRPBCC family protein [Amycolatopsis xylanica]SDW70823.1 Polyketide cyclase / dehydrase and lipid transport [Amycolatopsis xylanica]
MENPTGSARHQITVEAPRDVVYDLLAEPAHTARLSPTVVHVERLDGDDRGDVIGRWVADEAKMRTWQVTRELDRAGGRITFAHQDPRPPLMAMRGEWTLTEDGGATAVELRHDWTHTGDQDFGSTMDTGIVRQLAGLKRFAENRTRIAAAELTDESTVFVPGKVTEAADFCWGPALWSLCVENCRSAVRRQRETGYQVVELALGEAAPAPRFYAMPAPGKIVWKQTEGLPGWYRWLRGQITFTQHDDGVEVVARDVHSLDPDALTTLGWNAAEARDRVDRLRSDVTLDLLTGLAGFAEDD